PIVIEMTVPGQHYDSTNNRIRFVEGEWPAGKQVPIAGDKPYVEARPDDSTLIGVVARDPDTLNFLPILNAQGYKIKTIALQESQLPEDALQIEGLDYLVLNDVPAGTWSAVKLEA